MGIKGDERRKQALERKQQQYRKTAEELANLGYVMQGSIAKRWMACGKQACPCTDNPEARHGPYYAWTFKRGGKTACVYLSAEQADTCAQWIKNNRQLQRLVTKLRAITHRVAKLQQIPAK